MIKISKLVVVILKRTILLINNYIVNNDFTYSVLVPFIYELIQFIWPHNKDNNPW